MPRNTPADVVALLNKQINAALANPRIRGRVADMGGTASGGSPADFGKFIAEETEKRAKVVKFSGAKPNQGRLEAPPWRPALHRQGRRSGLDYLASA